MVLKVQSPFPGVLKYRLGIVRLDHDAMVPTSSCPLRQGEVGYEHWPFPIFQLFARDFRFVDPTSEAAQACEK